MRHVRMLGLSLVAVLAVGAMAATTAGAAKDPYSATTWEQYKYCPYTDTAAEYCFTGRTAGGIKGGYFQLGNALVKLSKPVVLQGAFIEEPPGGEPGGLAVVAATNGGETLEAPELTVTGGLGLITKRIQELAEWPAALKASFKEAQKNKEGHIGAKIEVAGNSLYENPNALSTEHLLFEKGNAFELPLKVRMINSWLEKLGGGPCQVGNDANPIMQDLTSEPPGTAGEVEFGDEFRNIELKGGRLTDLNWSVPAGADASGCGGATYESYVDKAINLALELPHQHGTTVLTGDLFTGLRKAVRAQFELGNWEREREVG